jgi:hypothetical protein
VARGGRQISSGDLVPLRKDGALHDADRAANAVVLVVAVVDLREQAGEERRFGRTQVGHLLVARLGRERGEVVAELLEDRLERRREGLALGHGG